MASAAAHAVSRRLAPSSGAGRGAGTHLGAASPAQAARLSPSPTVPSSAQRASVHRWRSHWSCRCRNWRNRSGTSPGASSAGAAEADATPVEPRGGRRRAAGGGGPPSAAATGPAVAPTGGVACGVRGAAGAVGGGLGCLSLPERPPARSEQPVVAAAPEPANGVTATSAVPWRRRWRRRCRHRAAPSCDRGAAGGGGGEGSSGCWQRYLCPWRRARLCGPRGAAVASGSRRHRPARGSGRQRVAPPLSCRRRRCRSRCRCRGPSSSHSEGRPGRAAAALRRRPAAAMGRRSSAPRPPGHDLVGARRCGWGTVGGEREGRRRRRGAERRPSPRACAASAPSSTDWSAEGCVQAREFAGDDEPLRRVSACGARRGDALAAALAAFLLPLPAVLGTSPTAVAGAHRAEEVPLRGYDPSEGRAQPCRGVGGGPTAAARCACAPAMGRWEGREWRGESPPCWWHGWGGRLAAGLAERTQKTKAAVRRGGGGGGGGWSMPRDRGAAVLRQLRTCTWSMVLLLLIFCGACLAQHSQGAHGPRLFVALRAFCNVFSCRKCVFWSFCSSFAGKSPLHPRERHDTGLAQMKRDVHLDIFLSGWRRSKEMERSPEDRYTAFLSGKNDEKRRRQEGSATARSTALCSVSCAPHALHWRVSEPIWGSQLICGSMRSMQSMRIAGS